jgi:hypothetical protein
MPVIEGGQVKVVEMWHTFGAELSEVLDIPVTVDIIGL